jgi:serine/threonine protein kinase
MSMLNEKLEAIFEAAVTRYPDSERTDYLERECPPELRQEIEALLAAHDNPDSLFADDTPRREAAPSEVPGTVIGPYQLLEPLGEGGFGTVWLAEQSEPVRRQVALKIIKLGMDTKQVVARFEVERQALALMDHPNIARVLDAGVTDNGRPYFVMELVHGISITRFCDANKLATAERLDLFIKVCHAVQHAHQKGIIHRDLKPSNVLVTLHDGVPLPKVIDFGVAKAINQKLTEQTLFTQFSTMIGTPAYMSPEQAEMSGLDVDTRSDIYSLGVLLYELLTGTTPFSEERLRSVACREMQRIIAEEEPERPSTRLKRKSAMADQAKSQILNLKSKIENDLDWIVMKCLEKDRTRRYDTANGLAADLKRHLNNEPVTACPPGAAYRFGKFVRRYKFAFAAGSAVAAALIAGLAMALLALARERAANERAEQQRRLAEQRLMTALQQVESVLTNDLPAVGRLAGSTRASENMLRNTLAFMSALAPNAEDDPEFLLASARVHGNLARLHGSRWGVSLGDPETALASASNAWRLLHSIPTGALPRVRVEEMTYRAEEATGMALEALGRDDEALAHYERMLTLATGLDQQLPRTGNCRWTSDAHNRLRGLIMGKGKWDHVREHNDHLFRDPYFLTNASSEDLGRLDFTALALWVRAKYYHHNVSNQNFALALDYYRQSLSFSEAYLKRANFDQAGEFGAGLTLINIGMVLCEQQNYAEGLPIMDEALHRMEPVASRDKANWNFQDVLAEILRAHAKWRAVAARAGVFSPAECLSLLEQARTSYQRCLERMNASAATSRQKSWVDQGADDVKRELEQVEAEIATLEEEHTQ